MNKSRYKVKTLQGYNGTTQNEQPRAKGFQTFESLEAYQFAREFRKTMYVVSRGLPDFEKFELASQIRRASVSLTNNIAEGHGRFHYPDQIKFLLQARGSLEELIDDLNVCLDENYLPATEIEAIKQQGWRALNVLNGYGRHLRQKRDAKKGVLKDAPIENTDEDSGDPFGEDSL